LVPGKMIGVPVRDKGKGRGPVGIEGETDIGEIK
jgi:hypothetical protein